MEIGKANSDSKEDNLAVVGRQCIRWCYYEINLFGDPTLTFVSTNNTAPTQPTKPVGIKKGALGDLYDFNTSATDLDGDKIYYKWSFGDGTMSKWLGPYDSGQEVNISHNWTRRGFYSIKVKARDEHRAESPWSDSLSVYIPRSKAANNMLFLRLLQRLLYSFPILSQLLK